MCFGGGGSNPIVKNIKQAPTPPAPLPSPEQPAEESAKRLSEERRRRLVAIKYGIGSTVLTSGAGDTSSLNLMTPTLMGTGMKTKLGQ